MNWFEAIFLGLIQGLTEFLPISSSAHLRIVGELLPGAQDPGAAFTAITQLGTETAVAVYFWKDIVRIIKSWFGSLFGRVPRNDPDARMGWLIIIGTIPIVVLGLLFQDQIESTFRSLWIVATMLIVFGIILAVADTVGRQQRKLDQLTYRHGILYGFAQALALIPGVSRSGGTITAGLLMGYTREAAARYAFLLAIPAVFGSGLFQLVKSLDEPMPYTALQTGAATVVAFVVGFIIIGWFLRYVSTRSYRLFVWYRILLGICIYLLLGFGVLTA
ncbi:MULTISPECIES: undecaprenyl-diphosphate phosphatase [unclassified Arthrobacter]|uniref:undecaprenyl-diphosphate phosphatase n=1 Tax=unclassified Arthrobacter TaxID=235627 RepID=UPI001D14B52E|nr:MULTISPECIES: undecaprenyl-diphosphate phosphatase [unclassified Arthrobacter]MCC3301425.1 undecaprenyl-diphosphate phosphatase [Arthrobacter sp. zg-Y895]MCC3291173.1 undecaprenyl-diphosphate phosphatase [Arthrobacter sp. zg-Y1110]MCQ1995493.1 undecaprenyl-diphosphate phosphatase [Arthrobacter sp. zg-Y1171]UWX80478.1 undecaprenyl-diphosphate phosphatase [Arthrobacter sp. zg-Y1171]UWX83606.1 undecaprenyl-diphosphate phosphatase [Arthrobacter sp. zg-Y1110]